MTISVIIPAHGREELLIRCLKSLDKIVQGDMDYEVCVIDDGSGLDEGSIRGKSDISCPLIWRRFETQRGRSAARNEGVRATRGSIIIFLDSDMEAREGFIRAHAASHGNRPHITAIGKIFWPNGGGFLRYIGSRGITKLKPGKDAPPWYFVTGNSSVERTDLPGNAPFDETISGWGGEDQDLGMKLAHAGIKFVPAPDAQAYHHFHGTLGEHLHRTELYGAGSLAVLASRYPELKHTLHLDILRSPAWRMLISTPVYAAFSRIAETLDGFPLPAKLYDYLTFAAYSRGFLEAEKNEIL
jgi:glycosyltransferase involved in cell wall biosynthesis